MGYYYIDIASFGIAIYCDVRYCNTHEIVIKNTIEFICFISVRKPVD